MLLIFYFKLFNLIILLIALIIIPKEIEFKIQLHLVLKIEEKKNFRYYLVHKSVKKNFF